MHRRICKNYTVLRSIAGTLLAAAVVMGSLAGVARAQAQTLPAYYPKSYASIVEGSKKEGCARTSFHHDATTLTMETTKTRREGAKSAKPDAKKRWI